MTEKSYTESVKGERKESEEDFEPSSPKKPKTL